LGTEWYRYLVITFYHEYNPYKYAVKQFPLNVTPEICCNNSYTQYWLHLKISTNTRNGGRGRVCKKLFFYYKEFRGSDNDSRKFVTLQIILKEKNYIEKYLFTCEEDEHLLSV